MAHVATKLISPIQVLAKFMFDFSDTIPNRKLPSILNIWKDIEIPDQQQRYVLAANEDIPFLQSQMTPGLHQPVTTGKSCTASWLFQFQYVLQSALLLYQLWGVQICWFKASSPDNSILGQHHPGSDKQIPVPVQLPPREAEMEPKMDQGDNSSCGNEAKQNNFFYVWKTCFARRDRFI